MDDKQKIALAREHGLKNVGAMFKASRDVGVPFAIACALFEKESHGRNVYGGHDGGGATMSGFPHPVNKGNFQVFWWLVNYHGKQSNGVGPSQITYRGLIEQMLDMKLKPWNVYDNMWFGLHLLKMYKQQTGSWSLAGKEYNGSASYGNDLAAKIRQWQERFTDV